MRSVASSDDGYYRKLGVEPGAPDEELRGAYLALVKKWHPDHNRSARAPVQFREVNEAYRAIKRKSPAFRPPPAPESVGLPTLGTPQPLRCSRCDRVTPNLRPKSYAAVVSLLIVSWRWRFEGVFCVSCARLSALKASTLSGLLGWWSIPGLALTPMAILRNAIGGKTDCALSTGLLLWNLLAFRRIGDDEQAAEAAKILAIFGCPLPLEATILLAEAPTLPMSAKQAVRDPWRLRVSDGILHAVCLAGAPMAFFPLISIL